MSVPRPYARTAWWPSFDRFKVAYRKMYRAKNVAETKKRDGSDEILQELRTESRKTCEAQIRAVLGAITTLTRSTAANMYQKKPDATQDEIWKKYLMNDDNENHVNQIIADYGVRGVAERYGQETDEGIDAPDEAQVNKLSGILRKESKGEIQVLQGYAQIEMLDLMEHDWQRLEKLMRRDEVTIAPFWKTVIRESPKEQSANNSCSVSRRKTGSG